MHRRLAHAMLSVAACIAIPLVACKPRVGGRCAIGQAACTDDKSGVFCGASGTYRAVACRGRDGCRREGALVSCDQSEAALGDSCTHSGFACAPDKKSALSCQHGDFVLAEVCHGPFGCRVAPFDGFAPGGAGNVLCDNDVSAAGDPCLDEGDVACTADLIRALRCTGRKMVLMRECDGAERCRVVHRTPKETDVECDPPTDDAGY